LISELPCAQGQITLAGGLDVACDLQVNQDKIPCLFLLPGCAYSQKEKKVFFETKGKSF